MNFLLVRSFGALFPLRRVRSPDGRAICRIAAEIPVRDNGLGSSDRVRGAGQKSKRSGGSGHRRMVDRGTCRVTLGQGGPGSRAVALRLDHKGIQRPAGGGGPALARRYFAEQASPRPAEMRQGPAGSMGSRGFFTAAAKFGASTHITVNARCFAAAEKKEGETENAARGLVAQAGVVPGASATRASPPAIQRPPRFSSIEEVGKAIVIAFDKTRSPAP